MSEWISVKDRLPEFHKRVLVVARPNLVVIAERGTLLKDVEWHWSAEGGSMFLHDTCTHWMPLPKPPTPELTIEEALKLMPKLKAALKSGDPTVTYDPSGSVTIDGCPA